MFRKLNVILAFLILLQILIQNIEGGQQQQENRTLEEDLDVSSDGLNRTKRWARFFDDDKTQFKFKGWTKKYITYKISKYTKQLRKKAVDRIIKKAFKLWEEPTKWKFKQRTSGYIDIDIKFLRGYFAGQTAGEAEILASYGVPYKGIIIFNDEDVHWRDTEDIIQIPSRKTLTASLAWTAAHEIGHVLGLGHSKVKGSVMIDGEKMPKYPGRKFSLHRDDKQGIRAIMKGIKRHNIIYKY